LRRILKLGSGRFFDLISADFRDREYRWNGTNLQSLVLMYNKNLVKDAETSKSRMI
jgi:hypothetical protein